MKEGAIPIRQGRRPIPIQYKERVREKLEGLLKDGIISGPIPVNEANGWIHNLVITDKSWDSNEIRITIDTKLMNDHVIKPKVPIPTPEEMRHNLRDSDRFSVVDCRDAFFHFALDEESRDLFKFNTEDGVFRFNVLVMGTPAASAECHAAMKRILTGLNGAIQIKDDILVHGLGKEHDANLQAVLKRLYEYGIRLRKEKCHLGKQRVIWFGHIFSKQGMSPDPAKVEHIKGWAAPQDKQGVKSFLQTCQFVSQYMRDSEGPPYADVTAPRRNLTRKNTHFVWSPESQESFEEVKRRISDKTVLVAFNPDLQTRLYVDHGPEGIAAAIAQRHTENNAPVWKTVHYDSRRLDKAEINYNKVEGESLAIYSGILRNRTYLSGTKFTVMTDHSSLPTLYKDNNKLAPHRVERHRGRLGAYNFNVEFVPGDKNPCDYGSRHPDPIPENLSKSEREDLGIETEEEDAELWINFVLDSKLNAITLEQLKVATEEDNELGPILKEKRAATKGKASSKGPYGKLWSEIKERDGVLLRDKKIIVPSSLQGQAIAIAHEGHMLTDGNLKQLRETQWFRNMREKVSTFVTACRGCASSSPQNPTPPLKLRKLPTIPWSVCHVDFKGPIGPNRWYLHTIMDAYSRYPETAVVKSTGFANIKKMMNTAMRHHGAPDHIWSDGGPPYNGKEWRDWVKSWGAEPHRTSAYNPKANGMVERFNQNLKKVILAAYAEKKDPEEEVEKYVAAYRNTPHTSLEKNLQNFFLTGR